MIHDALSISGNDNFQTYIEREPNTCFMKSYFVEEMQAWKANIDIQQLFNYYKAVTYMYAYYSKAKYETLEAMKQAAKEASVSVKSNFEKSESSC